MAAPVTKTTLKSADDFTTGALKGTKNLDELTEGLAAATKRLDDLDVDSLRQLRKLDDVGDAGDAAKKSSFLADNATTLLATGVAAGGLYYLEQKYDKAKEETKNCMKVCLPENWDDHAYGDLQKSDLIYKELPDAGDQPVCTESIPDCGKYCGDKCEEIHDYDAPGSGLVGGLAGDVGEGAGGLLGGLFGGLGKGLGIDGTTGMLISGTSFICCCMLIIMMVLLR
jgi:hypothetical protein